MTATQAMQQIKAGVIHGVRGVGCNAIVMDDGRRYHVVDKYSTLLERYDDNGNLVERVEAADVAGEADTAGWTVDESGGIYIR